MLFSLIAASTSSSAELTSTGVAALSTIAIIPTLVWAIVSGSVAAWFGHRYGVGGDEDYEYAVLGDATCPRCDHVITLAEAAPGRNLACTACSRRLPFSWLATQLAVIAGCIAMLATFGPRVVLLPFLWLVPVLVTASLTDLRTVLIPRRVVWVGFGVGFASIAGTAAWMGITGSLTSAIIGSAAYFGLLFLLHVIHPAGMGFGDVRLSLVLGLYLGWLDWRLTLFGLLIGNVVYLLYAGPRWLKSRGAEKAFPFGPALAAGTLLAIVFYSSLIPA